jgi:hypothetical protein
MRISKRSSAQLSEILVSPFDDPLFPSKLVTTGSWPLELERLHVHRLCHVDPTD